MTTFNIDPWVGEFYGKDRNRISVIKGLNPRILLVGESHYDYEGSVSNHRDFTRETITNYAIQSEINFFKHLRLTSLGGLNKNSEISCSEFWNCVAFCNLIEEIAPEPSRGISGLKSLEAGWRHLGEKVISLKPDIMLVYSMAAWNHEVPGWLNQDKNLEEQRIYENSDAIYKFTRPDNGITIAAGLNHLSRIGARRDAWIAIVELVWQIYRGLQ